MRSELKLVATEAKFAANVTVDHARATVGHQDLIGAVSQRRGDSTLRWLEEFVSELSDATILVDALGRRVVDSSAALLERDAERAVVEQRISGSVTRLAGELQKRSRRGTLDEVNTRGGRYRLRGTVVPDLGGVSGAFALLAVDRISLRPPDIDEARSAFGVTVREGEIALLLTERLTTSQIAARLGISIHTVRRHTENVFRKLGVRSRGDVLTALQAGRRSPPTQ